jgi:hypothetical protein
MIDGERHARALPREVRTSNGNRDWLRFWEIGHGHLGDRARVRRDLVQSFAVQDSDGHTLRRANQCQSRLHSASLEKLHVPISYNLYVLFPQRYMFQSTRPNQSISHL